MITYGLMPVLAAPTPSAGEGLIEEAVVMAAKNGVVKANDHVVVLSRTMGNEFILQVVTLDEQATGIKNIRPKSLLDMLKAISMVNQAEEEADGPGKRPFPSRQHSVLVGSRQDPLVVKPHELNDTVANGTH